MDQQEENIENNQENFTQVFKRFKLKYDQAKPLNLANVQNTAVAIFGLTKSGKSTFFHLLKGDRLITNQDTMRVQVDGQQESFIGHDFQSYTKKVNQFTIQSDPCLDLIDSPGIEDTSEDYDEIASSLHLIRLLQEYKRIIFLLVIPMDYFSSSQIQLSLNYVYNLMQSEKDINYLCQQQMIALIINRTRTSDYVNEKQKIMQSFRGIQQQGFQAINLLHYFQQGINNNVFFLNQSPDKHHLDECRLKILNFIQLRKLNYQKIFYKFNLSNKGKITTYNFIKSLSQFCQEQLENQLKLMFQKINQLEIEKRIIIFLFLNSLHLIQIPLQLFFKIQKLIQEKFQIFQLQDCLSQALINIQQEFDEKYLQLICELDFNYSIQISEDITNQINNDLNQYYKKNLQNKLQNEEEINLFQQISKALIQFRDLNYCDQINIFIGLPLCGKTSIIKHIYNNPCMNQNPFSNNQLQFDQDLVKYYFKNKTKIIEFRSLQVEVLVLLQYFFNFCQEDNKQFRIYVVINSNQEGNNKQIINLLELFINFNNFQNLSFISYIQNIQFIQNIQTQFILQSTEIVKFLTLKRNFDQFEEIEHNYMPEEINIQLNNLNMQSFYQISHILDVQLQIIIARTRDLINQQNQRINCLSHYRKSQLNHEDVNVFIALSEIDLQSQNRYKQIRTLYSILNINDEIMQNQDSFNVFQKIKKAINLLTLGEQYQLFLKKHFYIIEWCDQKIQIIYKIIDNFQTIKNINQLDKIQLLLKISELYPEPLLERNDIEMLQILQDFYSSFIKPNQIGQPNNNNQYIKENLPELTILLNTFQSATKKLENIAKLIKKSQKYGFTAQDSQILKFFLHTIVYLLFDLYENKRVVKQLKYNQIAREYYLNDQNFKNI